MLLCLLFEWKQSYLLLQDVHRLNQGWDVPLQAINQFFIYQIVIEAFDSIHLSIHIMITHHQVDES